MPAISTSAAALTPSWAQRMWRATDNVLTRALATPLAVDDYLQWFNPLWSSRTIRAEVVAVQRETPSVTTISLRPNAHWPGHRAGQHVLLTVQCDGVRHSRCFTIASGEQEPLLRLTIKAHEQGLVSREVLERMRDGDLVELSAPQGEFLLPEGDGPLLMICGGSGITPMLSMLRTLAAAGQQRDVVLVHYYSTAAEALAVEELAALAAQWPQLRSLGCCTREAGQSVNGGRFSLAQLQALVPDAATRQWLLCGPAGLMDAVRQASVEAGVAPPLSERFELSPPTVVGEGEVHFARSAVSADGEQGGSLLELAEQAGLTPRYGCRMGICQACKCHVDSGLVRDLRTGEVREVRNESVQICVHAPAGPVQVQL